MSLLEFYTPQYQYYKAVSLVFCLHILNVSQYFIQKLPWLSVLLQLTTLFYFFLFKEIQDIPIAEIKTTLLHVHKSGTGARVWLFLNRVQMS